MGTTDYLKPICGALPAEIYWRLQETYDRFDITSGNRRNYFLTHLIVESAYLKKFEESLYYTTPQRIVQVWPSRFSMEAKAGKLLATEFVRNPQKLANIVYAGRGGNKEVGDGWKYRGRGPIGLTFRDTYKAFADFSGIDVVANPDLLVTDMRAAILSAGWFFTTYKNILPVCDAGNFPETVRLVNGSLATVPERTRVLNEVVKCQV